MSYQLFIFDFDGTLADTRQAVFRSMQATLAALHPERDIPQSRIEAVVASGATLPDAFAQLLGNEVEAAVTRYREIYAEHSDRWTVLYPGVARFLSAAQQAGRALAVVSNKGEPALRAALTTLGIAEHFALILGEQKDLPPKPAPDIFTHRIRPAFSAIPSAQMVFIGDTPADLAFATAAGIDAAWVTHGHGDPVACRALSPRHEIDHFDQMNRQLLP